MSGIIQSGQLCTVAPISSGLKKGDVVLCKVGRSQYLHLITSIRGDRYQISNNKGHVNGWVDLKNIFGILIKVES